MRLLGVELTRYRSRRAVVLLLLLAAVIPLVIAVALVWDTRPISAADIARAEQLAAAEAEQPYIQRELRRCEARPEQYIGPGGDAASCAEFVLPQADWYLARNQLRLGEQVNGAGLAAVVVIGALVMIAGATFAGADWASGSMSNQLLFDPRRAKVWAAKGLAVLLGGLVVALAILVVFWTGLYVVAQLRDIDTGSTVQTVIRWQIVRGSALVALAGLAGYALTMLLRSTVGTLAAMFAYAVAGEIVLALLPFGGMGRWSLANNTSAWIAGQITYWDNSLTCPRGGDSCDKSVVMTQADGALFLMVLLAAVVAVSVVAFRRRDIP